MDKALTVLDSTILCKEDIIAIMNLWNQDYPANLSYTSTADFEAYTKTESNE